MRSFIVSIIFMAALAVAWPVDLSWGSATGPPQLPPKQHPVVKRDYDPRTDAPVRVPADPEDAEGEDRVKRDYDPRTDAPVRVPVDSDEAEGEDRVKRDLSFSPNTEAPQKAPKAPFDRVKRDYDPRTDAPVRVPADPEDAEGEDRVKRDLSFSPNTEAPQKAPKAPFDRVKRDYDPRTDAPVRVPVDSEEADGEDRVKRDLSFSPNTEAPQKAPKAPFDRVKRDYDPRTDAPVRVPVDSEEAEGEGRVKRDYDPRTDAPVRVPADSAEAEGEDRV